jgi:hypothetical protein
VFWDWGDGEVVFAAWVEVGGEKDGIGSDFGCGGSGSSRREDGREGRG